MIGEHNGIINFTIGQRKGIRISNKEPLYVLNIDAHKNEVIVGKYIDLAVNKIYIKDINLLGNLDEYKKNLLVKVRSTGKLIKTNIKFNNKNAEVTLQETETGISPGQACVFYTKNRLGDKVLGGGWISKADNKYLST